MPPVAPAAAHRPRWHARASPAPAGHSRSRPRGPAARQWSPAATGARPDYSYPSPCSAARGKVVSLVQEGSRHVKSSKARTGGPLHAIQNWKTFKFNFTKFCSTMRSHVSSVDTANNSQPLRDFSHDPVMSGSAPGVTVIRSHAVWSNNGDVTSTLRQPNEVNDLCRQEIGSCRMR
ncbi:protein of unknown function [Rhodovastum atsumiense]|nr:protein of unknown function [Rhodovastum atsumiense]